MMNSYEIVFEEVSPSKIEEPVAALVNAETTISTQNGPAGVLPDALIAARESGAWIFLNSIVPPWPHKIGRHFSARVINYGGNWDFEIHFQSKVLGKNERMLLLEFCCATRKKLSAKGATLREMA